MTKCKCVYETAKNTPAVRTGHVLGGAIKEECDYCKQQRSAPMTDQKQAPEAFRRYYDHGLNFTDPSGYYVAYADYEALAKQRDELAESLASTIESRNRWMDAVQRAKTERDELAAEVERLKFNEEDFAGTIRHKNRQIEKALKDGHEVFIKVRNDLETARAERDEALAASAAREIAMRDRAAEPLIDVAASLSATISLLERGGEEAAASDKMFAQMITDYKASLERARTHLNDPLSPDGQQALDDVRANAWDEGYDQALKDDFGSKGYTQNPYRKGE